MSKQQVSEVITAVQSQRVLALVGQQCTYVDDKIHLIWEAGEKGLLQFGIVAVLGVGCAQAKTFSQVHWRKQGISIYITELILPSQTD